MENKVETMQQTRAQDKIIGYQAAVWDMMQLLQGIDNEQASILQLKMIEKMGKYQRPSPNAYDHLDKL